MSIFARDRRGVLERRVDELRDEIAELAGALTRHGSHAMRQSGREASGYYDELQDTLSAALPALRRRTRVMEKTVRNHPAPMATAVGLTVLAIAAAAWFSRR